MSLFICPDCGHDVSDRAAACLHCGCPMEQEQKKQLDYALVLYAADYNDPEMVARISTVAGCSQEEAARLRQELPVVLKRGLSFQECSALIRSFSRHTQLGVIRDADADAPADAEPIPLQQGLVKQPPKPLTFWSVVGAILTAWGIIIVATWLLGWVLSLGMYR